MAIKNTTTIKLERENIAGEYGEGWQYVWLGDGDRISIEVGDDLDEVIAFLERVQDMQKPKFVLGEPEWKPEWQVTEVRTSEPTPPVWLPNCKPGDVCVRRDGRRLKYEGPSSSIWFPHRAGDGAFTDNGAWSLKGKPHPLDIIAVIPSDHSGPSGTACDTLAKECAR